MIMPRPWVCLLLLPLSWETLESKYPSTYYFLRRNYIFSDCIDGIYRQKSWPHANFLPIDEAITTPVTTQIDSKKNFSVCVFIGMGLSYPLKK